MGLLKEKFSGSGSSRERASQSVQGHEVGETKIQSGSANATPEMVRRRIEVAEDNEAGGKSQNRRTSTPEIVRIRTTRGADSSEAAAEATTASGESNKGQDKSVVVRHGLASDTEIVVRKSCDQDKEAQLRSLSGAEVVRYKVQEQQSRPTSDMTTAVTVASGEKTNVKKNPCKSMNQRQVRILDFKISYSAKMATFAILKHTQMQIRSTT